jgi:hypothetical protein
MITREMITSAYHRLLNDLGTEKERRAISRNEPDDLPSEAELMSRATSQAALDSSIGTNHLRAALELAGRDQEYAETREINLVALLRDRGVSWREIAYHRGLRSAQAAQQRYDRLRLSRAPETLIYAFRDVGTKDAPWHGDPDALPAGRFETGLLDFNPSMPRPFSGRTLEMRYGPVEAEVMPSYLRAYALVAGRRFATTAAVQVDLFGG